MSARRQARVVAIATAFATKMQKLTMVLWFVAFGAGLAPTSIFRFVQSHLFLRRGKLCLL